MSYIKERESAGHGLGLKWGQVGLSPRFLTWMAGLLGRKEGGKSYLSDAKCIKIGSTEKLPRPECLGLFVYEKFVQRRSPLL